MRQGAHIEPVVGEVKADSDSLSKETVVEGVEPESVDGCTDVKESTLEAEIVDSAVKVLTDQSGTPEVYLSR